jgi:hypothetical protein
LWFIAASYDLRLKNAKPIIFDSFLNGLKTRQAAPVLRFARGGGPRRDTRETMPTLWNRL